MYNASLRNMRMSWGLSRSFVVSSGLDQVSNWFDRDWIKALANDPSRVSGHTHMIAPTTNVYQRAVNCGNQKRNRSLLQCYYT